MKIEVVGFPGQVEIDPKEYTGDMDEFIKKIRPFLLDRWICFKF